LKKGPRKPVVKPSVKMRPLFWTRIIIDESDSAASGDEISKCVWSTLLATAGERTSDDEVAAATTTTNGELVEPAPRRPLVPSLDVQVADVEMLFSQKAPKAKTAGGSGAGGAGDDSAGKPGGTGQKPGQKGAPLFQALDSKRAQALGILMGSSKVSLEQIKQATWVNAVCFRPVACTAIRKLMSCAACALGIVSRAPYWRPCWCTSLATLPMVLRQVLDGR
jgi:hypothetical protein